MRSINLSNIDILNIIALALLQNIDLNEKVENYKNWRSIKIFEAVDLLQILIEMKKVENLN